MVFNSFKKFISDKLDSKINKILTTERLLSQLYIDGDRDTSVAETGKNKKKIIEYFDNDKTASTISENGLPVPSLGRMTMGYGSSIEGYLEHGQKSATRIRDIEERYGIAENKNKPLLDWGCTTGRVLRHFAEDAQQREIWGIDVDRPSIDWAKANISPPFHFLCCSAYPYLPFPDNTFSLIYGLSVMTHLLHFRDMWLMELKRILCPNGLLILTINNEFSVSLWQEGKAKSSWWVKRLDLEEVLKHEVTTFRGNNWANSYTIFHSKYIQREWGQYLEILEIEQPAEGTTQSAVIMRKK